MKLALRIMSFPYRLIVNNTVGAIRDIKDNAGEEGTVKRKIFNAIALVPFAASIVVFIIALISFIVGGGFAQEVDLVKSEGFGALNDIWTTGTSGLFYNPWISIGVGVVFASMLVIAAIDLYLNAATWKKIVFSVVFALFAALSSAFTAAAIDDSNFDAMLKLVGATDSNGITIAMLIGLGLELILAVAIMLLLKGFTPFTRCFVNTVFYFAIAPLTCLLIENIIGLAVFAVLMTVIVIAGNIAGHSLDSTPEEDAAREQAYEAEKAAKERKKKLDRIEMLEYDIKKRNEAVRKHYKGEFGYGTIDPKECAKVNRRKAEEAQQLRDSLL